MRLLHVGWRRRLSLLASGVLEGSAREEMLRHLETCPRCREERAALEAVLDLVAADPARGAEPPVPVEALVTRVEARLDAVERARPGLRWRWAVLALAAAAALAAALVPQIVPRPEPPPVKVSEEALRRIEGNVAREQAARYLSEAQDVLVSVAARPRNCGRENQRADVEAASQQSRELLARRALLLEPERAEVASARPVLDDVEQMLREVASLESCARVRDLERVREEMARRQLLMKIRLMTRELEG
jgi:anti-sigma factor RsiW